MSKTVKLILIVASLLSAATLITWQVTGGDYYTKYQIVEKIEKEIDPDDPLAQAGFYDEESMTETVTRDAFRLGLLPTPSGIFDKHAVSVISIIIPVWIVTAIIFWISRKKRKAVTHA